MAEFFDLSADERLEALAQAADASGRPPHLLEKDVWVVWSLRHLFAAPYAPHLVFKGGTSLSKAYGVIQRFSEDVDLTYDIRAIAANLIGDAGVPLPASKSQEKKWSKEIRARLADWVATNVVPLLQQDLGQHGLPATVRAEDDKVFIDYRPLASGTGYVPSTVMLEFGARSTGEPCELRSVRCDAAAHLWGVEFPEATPQVMRAERTFWEKATAIHVFCAQGAFRGGDRFARHWHDVTRLDAAGFADSAIADTALANAVADHKSVFFSEKNLDGGLIDYYAAVAGGLRLVPDDGALAKLAADYQHMIDDGLFLDEVEPFEVLMDRCGTIQRKANTTSPA
ncbi:nucleotidyl transferase AbiEii/AbiGii toxin family protein [Variovorax fucosicus]|uniref:nucleotidyl transferase AbiEii/AbiGii toxin family protein n=1 Tax=Variovorax fucosicus TaxID=3053517 RepID=UPI002578BA09|nr:nucleotidyl transferase AbiEii/AbiGii toxin family protein [Variovorax sp. J22G47]MDM0057469.1 nucleotidyl transferase AbiEii/AbiGii toxin family protein [Variovorax sp. J22G47]